MPRFRGEPDYEHDSGAARTGVLLNNLGTPAAPETGAVRRYLAEFLWDRRVVEVPRPAWWLILHGLILRTRPRHSAAAYAKIWTEAGSPLLVHTRAQAADLTEVLGGSPDVVVGMSYGEPSIRSALAELRSRNVRRVLVLPLYPQYSGSTTGATFDGVTRVLRDTRWIPELRFVNSYHDHPGYIAALAASIAEHWQDRPRGERLLFSFHGIPRAYLDQGDPYHCFCHRTARLTADALGLDDAAWHVAFQSRLGRAEWLRPYTDEVLPQWAADGVANVDVVCPGFAADCLETLEEVALRYAALFRSSGGRTLNYIPALNERADHIDLLASLVREHTVGWGRNLIAAEPHRTLARAKALGAQR